MNAGERTEIINKVKEALISAGSTFTEDKFSCYGTVLNDEENDLSKWAMETIVENAKAAKRDRSPLCDDTGIPHLMIEIGKNRSLSGDFIDAIYEGVREGLKQLPGRPMAIMGDDNERISQSGRLDERSDAVLPAPLMLRKSENADLLKLTILMQGGGPEIRAKTYRIFHRHSMDCVIDEIIAWAKESVPQLGCSPCTLAVGIGRSHYEASSLMIQAMAEGNYNEQTSFEKKITEGVNEIGSGALGLGGAHSVLATFMKVGPQRASGVRIVCMRPCCCFEPRKSSVEF